MRRDPSNYKVSKFVYRMNKHDQDEANRKAHGAQHSYKKKIVKPGDDEYVEDVL
jgi:hypothetical protein